MTTQDQIIALADELGGEVRLDYSGRGMFGARCMGIVCEDSEQVILNALGRGLPRGKVDSMGTRKIVYWPGIQAAGKGGVAPVRPPCASAGLLPGAREVALAAENARLIGVIQSHADRALVAQTALRAALEYAEAATCDLWEDLKAYGDLSRAVQVAAVIVKARAALAGKGGAC